MIDQYGRTIDYLRLSVTDLCNYRCQYCMPADGVEKGPHGAVLSVEEYGEIARAAVKPVSYTHLTLPTKLEV